MRCFIAVPLPAPARDALAGLAARVRVRLPDARLVRPDQMHLTLHFFEDLDEAGVAAAVEALHAGVGDAPAFALAPGAPGVFPGPRGARVVWIGLARGADRLGGLHDRIGEALRARGLPVDARPFAPHLTLARLPRPVPLDPGALGIPPDAVPAIPVDRVVLFRSVLGPGGAVHTALATAVLAGVPEDANA